MGVREALEKFTGKVLWLKGYTEGFFPSWWDSVQEGQNAETPHTGPEWICVDGPLGLEHWLDFLQENPWEGRILTEPDGRPVAFRPPYSTAMAHLGHWHCALSTQEIPVRFLGDPNAWHLGHALGLGQKHPLQWSLPRGGGWIWHKAMEATASPSDGDLGTARRILSHLFHTPSTRVALLLRYETIHALGSLMAQGEAPPPPHFLDAQRAKKHVQSLLPAVVDGASCVELTGLCPFWLPSRGEPPMASAREWDWRQAAAHHGAVNLETLRVRYENWTRMPLPDARLEALWRYMARLAHVSGEGLASTFDVLLAFQGVCDSNLAHEALQMFRTAYAPQEDSPWPQKSFDVSEFCDATQLLVLERFRTLSHMRPQKRGKPRLVKESQRAMQAPLPESAHANQQWILDMDPTMCSHTDEDYFLDELVGKLRTSQEARLMSRKVQVRELEADLGDGLDLRETARHAWKDSLYIREENTTPHAPIGTVVLQFAPDTPENIEKFNWKTFWVAESHDATHLMFYATDFRKGLIGPGIAKSEFGGLAAIPVPCYLDNPWMDHHLLSLARSPVEMLLLAGAVATDHPTLLLVGPTPPDRVLLELLHRNGKKLIWQPLSQIPPGQLRKLRTFHILAEAGVRGYAHKYILKDSIS